MSTRTHWLRPIDKRITACGRNSLRADVFAGSAAEYLGISNFCVKCEHAAQKEEALSSVKARGTGKSKLLPAPQWPDPRPIAEVTGTKSVLGWFPSLCAWVVAPPREPIYRNYGYHMPTHFLPLPPAPEVRK